MRKICLLVIALALVSVTNQNLLSFGEFIEGHETAHPKKYRVRTGSTAVLAAYALTNKIFVDVRNTNSIVVDSACGISSRTSNVKKSCSSQAQKAHDDAKNILFAEPNAAKILFNHKYKLPFPFKTSKGFLALTKA